MKSIVVDATSDNFTVGVSVFCTSLTWHYLTHRYPHGGAHKLLLALTLSGLDVWWWEACAMHLVKAQYGKEAVTQFLTTVEEVIIPALLRSVVGEIWTYALEVGALVGKPPVCPAFLLHYGVTAEGYVAALQALYEEAVEEVYLQPWPEKPTALPQPLIQPILLQQAVAVMGVTAGAIERLMRLGGQDDHHDE